MLGDRSQACCDVANRQDQTPRSCKRTHGLLAIKRDKSTRNRGHNPSRQCVTRERGVLALAAKAAVADNPFIGGVKNANVCDATNNNLSKAVLQAAQTLTQHIRRSTRQGP